MSEQELLTLAAKAVGIEIYFSDDGSCYHKEMQGNPSFRYRVPWNPLTDDGDALRLVVKLGIRVRCDHRAGYSWVKRGVGSTPHDGDPYAATRRAIVRAAAEIGKAMP